MYIVCHIHNNSLGAVVEVETEEEGINLILDWCRDNGFNINQTDIESIENNLEYHNDDDCDNITTFAIGMIETL